MNWSSWDRFWDSFTNWTIFFYNSVTPWLSGCCKDTQGVTDGQTLTEWIFTVTRTVRPSLILPPVHLSGRRGNNCPSWRHLQSITHINTRSSHFAATISFWSAPVNTEVQINCPVSSSAVPLLHHSSRNLPGQPERDLLSLLARSLHSCLSCAGYLYSFVLRKIVQIKFWVHQHFPGPTAAQ